MLAIPGFAIMGHGNPVMATITEGFAALMTSIADSLADLLSGFTMLRRPGLLMRIDNRFMALGA